MLEHVEQPPSNILEEALQGIDIQFFDRMTSFHNTDIDFGGNEESEQGVNEDLLATSERYRITQLNDKIFKIKYRSDGIVYEEINSAMIPGILPRMSLKFMETLIPTRTTTCFEIPSDVYFESFIINVILDIRSPNSFIDSFLIVEDQITCDFQAPIHFEIQWGEKSEVICPSKLLLKLLGKYGSEFYLDAFVVQNEEDPWMKTSKRPYILLGRDFLEKYLKSIQIAGGGNFYFFEDRYGMVHKTEFYLVSDVFAGV